MMSSKLRRLDIPEVIKSNAEIASAVQHASDILELYAPPSGVHVSASWDLNYNDSHSPILGIKMSDKWDADASAKFSLGELHDEETLERRLNWLWADLLQDRSHKQIEELQRYEVEQPVEES